MKDEPWYRRMMQGGGGLVAAPLRGVLRAAALGYGLAVNRRNAYFDAPRHRMVLGVPVISVGRENVAGS